MASDLVRRNGKIVIVMLVPPPLLFLSKCLVGGKHFFEV